MKKHLSYTISCLLLFLFPFNQLISQSQEAQQLLLNVEKLAQLKQILNNMKKGYQLISSGYEKVKNISKGNFNLHKDFLDALMQVSSTVKNYRKVAMIISTQLSLVREYRQAYTGLFNSGLFTIGELQYMKGVTDNLLTQSLKNLEEFAMVITGGKLRMSDAERLTAIDNIYNSLQDKLVFLRSFINKTRLLGAGRKQQQYEIDRSRKYFGITP